MNNLVLASSSSEAAALSDATTRLAETAGTLETLGGNLLAAAANPARSELFEADHGALVEFAEKELLPWSASLAGAFSSITGSPELNLLALLASAHNARLAAAAKALEVAGTAAQAVGSTARLQEAASNFLTQATELVLPMLAQNTEVFLADLMPGKATPQGAVATESQAPASGGCACGGQDEPGLAELDTRVIPHAIRHATIFGALEGLNPGKGILLLANHNPLPLLAQLEQRSPGKFAVDFVEDGPDLWKLSMVRK